MSAQSLVQQGYYGYAGWGDAEADADFRATGGAGKGGPQAAQTSGGGVSGVAPISGIDPVQTARQIQQFQVEANQPAIQTLQGQQEPLKQRYQSIIADIKGKEALATKTAEISTAREYGKRGIPTSSGAYDVALREATTPISTQFGGLYTQAGASEQQDLMNIATQIAQLQAGNAPQALSTATGLIGLQQQSQQLQQQQQIANQPNTEVITAGGRKLLVNKQTGATIADLGASTEGGGGLSDSVLAAILGGGQLNTQPTEPKPTTRPSSGGGQRGGFGVTTGGYA